MGVLIKNSVFYTTVSTLAVIVLSMAAAFAFAKIKSKATPILYGSFVIGILLTIQSDYGAAVFNGECRESA